MIQLNFSVFGVRGAELIGLELFSAHSFRCFLVCKHFAVCYPGAFPGEGSACDGLRLCCALLLSEALDSAGKWCIMLTVTTVTKTVTDFCNLFSFPSSSERPQAPVEMGGVEL